MNNPLPHRIVTAVACVFAVFALFTFSSTLRAADPLPPKWDESDGNPIKIDGQPRWRADRLWPDSPLQADAYIPLPWTGDAWKAIEHDHGGQPRISIDNGQVTLSARAAAPGKPGLKIPALVYIVPEDGWYGLSGEAKARRFDGYGQLKLQLARRTPDRVDLIQHWSLEPDKALELSGVAIKADKGDEIILMMIADRAAVDTKITNLAIGTDLVDQRIKSAREKLANLPKSPARIPTDQQLAQANAAVTGDGLVPPADSGIANIKAFGAMGDGIHDDTAAFQLALTGQGKARMLYVPDGTYLITDTLRWGDGQKRQAIQGQSENGAIIKLIDACPGYQSPNDPKSMIWTGKSPAQRFQNAVRNITLDTGAGNGGAIGVQFIANNQGGMFNVTIRSSDPDRIGVIGLDLGYSNEQGPCLIQNVTVEGFDTGVYTKHAVDGVVAEHITLRNQNKVGWLNDGQCVSLRGLKSENAVTAYHNREQASLTAIIDSDLKGAGQTSTVPAILNNRGLFARNITTSGYAMAIENTDGTKQNADGAKVDEFVSHEVLTLFADPATAKSLNLPIKETPDWPWEPREKWVSVSQYKPERRIITRKDNQKVTLDDWAPALQQAIDSGATTIYFPPERSYGLFSDVHVRGNVRRISAFGASFNQDHGAGTNCDIIVEDGDGPVRIERMDISYAPVNFRHVGNRPLVIANVSRNEWGKITKEKESGDLFINDVVYGQLIIEGGNVWARQLNLEGWNLRPKIINHGTLWVLGYKSEEDAIQLHNFPGSAAEIVGGFVYANKMRDPAKIMFINDNALLSFTVGEWVIRKQPFNPVREIKGDQTKTLKAGQTPPRGEGAMIPLFVGQSK